MRFLHFHRVGIGLLVTVVAALTLAQADSLTLRQTMPQESSITYRLKHPLKTVMGKSEEVACEVGITQDTLSSRIHCSVAVATFNSGDGNRDSHVLETVHALKFPSVQFSGRTVSKVGAGAESLGTKQGESWHIEGELDFHGVKKPLTFAAQLSRTGGKATVTGSFPVSLTAHGIKRPSLLFLATEDTVYIDLNLVTHE